VMALHCSVNALPTFDAPTAASVLLGEILGRSDCAGLNGAERWLLGGRANS
jgi:hypothetical protein